MGNALRAFGAIFKIAERFAATHLEIIEFLCRIDELLANELEIFLG